GRGAEKEKSQEKAQPRRGAEEKAQPQRSQRDRDHTTGQSPSQTQPGQAPQRQEGQQRPQTQPQQGEMQRGQQTQPSQGQAQQGRSGGNVSLTTEQRTQIRQSVLAGSNVPRVNNVNFALSVGTAVPTSVHGVEVPTVIVNIHPEWRGFYYFVVNDEIIIVDRGHKIVAVLAV